MEDKIRESCLILFGHINHRPFNDLAMRADILNSIYVKKVKGTPKKIVMKYKK